MIGIKRGKEKKGNNLEKTLKWKGRKKRRNLQKF